MKPVIRCFSKLNICSLVLVIIVFSPFRVSAQDNKLVLDSLQTLLKTASDSQKIRLVAEQVVRLLDCKDTLAKIKLGEQAKQQAENIKWNLEIANANRALGDVYFDCMHNYAKGFEYFQANVILAQKSKDKINESYALEDIAKHYEKISQHANAINYFDKVLSLNPEAYIQMGTLADIGVIYTNIGDFSHALFCYTSSLKVLDSLLSSRKTGELQDSMQMVGLLLNIGDIYLSMSQPDKSLENFNKALKISKELNDNYLEVFSLLGIAKSFSSKKNYDQAIEYYLMALKDCPGDGNKTKILPDLATAYLYSGSYDKAMECAQNALQIGEKYKQDEQIQKAYATLGMIYLKQNQYATAVSYLQKSLTLSQKTGLLDAEKDAWQALSTAYKQMGKPREALDAYTNFISIRDSLYSISKANELTRIDLEYAFDKKQIEDTAVYNEKIQRQQIFTYASFAGAALVLLLSFFIYRNYNTQKKYNALLKKEQERQLAHISRQDTVLSDIAHTQAHFVRGPIATILGLLQLYNHEDLSDPINNEVVDGITFSIEKLDKVVKDVVIKENKLRRETNT